MKQDSRSGRTVWIVDDDATTLLLAGETLAAEGLQIRTFASASEALAAAQEAMPDIIVVDVLMPGMDGFEFCAKLRELPAGRLVPILVMTSLEDTASIEKAYEAGATNFAIKPLNWSIEVHRLDHLIRSAKMANELLEKEHETRQAKEDWERTFNSIVDGVTVLDTDLRILRANAATTGLFNLTPGQILGRKCYDLFHIVGERCTHCPAAQVLATNTPAAAEIQCQAVGKLFEITISPVTDSQGRITHLVHVARDLSEKKELEAELRQAQKMEAIGTLAGGIAHDFNNLLTVIQGCAETLRSEEAATGRNHENSEAILETAKRGAALTKQLLVFSRRKEFASQKRLVDLNETLKNLRQMLAKGLSPTVTQEFHLDEGLHRIKADPSQLEQVVMNLAVNAAQAMPAGGTLRIETKNIRLDPGFCQAHADLTPGDHVLLTVTDTGQGMDKETQARIYEPFFSTKKLGEGTGLGLSVVFGIVREHKGLILCQSAVDEGTTFQIYFPAIQQVGPKLHALRIAPQAIPGGSETILVVDDESNIRRLLTRHFTRLGYQVMEAPDGEAALSQYGGTGPRPALVILDLGMPNMSGWECLEKLRSFDPTVKVLVASGFGATDLEAQVLAHGAKDFLHKPYDLVTMSKKVRQVLDGKPEK